VSSLQGKERNFFFFGKLREVKIFAMWRHVFFEEFSYFFLRMGMLFANSFDPCYASGQSCLFWLTCLLNGEKNEEKNFFSSSFFLFWGFHF